MARTKIQWTEQSWNPIVGCTRVSEGCRHCYAETMARRLQAMGKPGYEGVVNGNGRWTGVVNLVPEKLDEPLKRKKPTMWFVNSMSDLFHESIPTEWIAKIFTVMRRTPQHTYQILTKRPERMRKVMGDEMFSLIVNSNAWADYVWPLPNVWLGISAEDQKAADERVPLLLRTPAAVRFVSCEPLLGPVSLADIQVEPGVSCNSLKVDSEFLGIHRQHLNWVIAGGESGPKARPMHPDWVRQLRDQCQEAGVAFFLKQWGAWKPLSEEEDRKMNWTFDKSDRFLWVHPDTRWRPSGGPYADWQPFYRVGKKAAGRLLDGREWSEFPDAR